MIFSECLMWAGDWCKHKVLTLIELTFHKKVNICQVVTGTMKSFSKVG